MRTRLRLFLCLAALLLPATGWADDAQDRARRAVERGAIMPLRAIVDIATRDFQARLLDAELEEEDGIPVYELKLVTQSGQVLKAEYDARTAELRKVKGRGPDHLRHHHRKPEGER